MSKAVKRMDTRDPAGGAIVMRYVVLIAYRGPICERTVTEFDAPSVMNGFVPAPITSRPTRHAPLASHKLGHVALVEQQ